MNTEVKTGLMTSATNNDELKTTMSVMGKYFMNSPVVNPAKWPAA